MEYLQLNEVIQVQSGKEQVHGDPVSSLRVEEVRQVLQHLPQNQTIRTIADLLLFLVDVSVVSSDGTPRVP